MYVVLDGIAYEVPRDIESLGSAAIAVWLADLIASLTPDPE